MIMGTSVYFETMIAHCQALIDRQGVRYWSRKLQHRGMKSLVFFFWRQGEPAVVS